MKKRVKRKWVAALKSGKYKQGKRRLRDRKKHCCLGVLCEIAVAEGVIPKYKGSEIFLPLEVQVWAGLDQPDPLLGRVSASVHNDGRYTWERPLPPKSFDEIADLIDEYL